MQVLIFGDPHDMNIYDVSTTEKMIEALCMIFDYNEETESYEDVSNMDENEKNLYLSAKGGNSYDKTRFVESRNTRGVEYETFEIVETMN